MSHIIYVRVVQWVQYFALEQLRPICRNFGDIWGSTMPSNAQDEKIHLKNLWQEIAQVL